MKRVRRARPVRRAGIVLCGGRSSRMGRAKAWLPWFGRTMIEHVVESLRPAVDEVIVVTSASLDLPALDVRVVVDRQEGRGPLAGIREGLAAANAERAFVTSTDVPFLTTRYVERLFAHAGAVAPVAEERVQVLSAVYPCAAWSQADALLERGIARPLALLESVGYTPLDEPVSSEAPAWRGFNTPGEYLDCARAVDPAARAELELLGRAALGTDRRVRSVPIGTLSELLAYAPPGLKILEGDRVAPAFLVSLGGRDLVRNARVPIGPGERVSVLDGLAGG